MLRYTIGAASALLFVLAGFFLWNGRAAGEDPIPKAPAPVALATPLQPQSGDDADSAPPAATEKSKEEKRFGRADKDKDGKITLEELYQPRRKAYAKLDTNGDGRLAFEEWAATTSEKFAGADGDKSGWLSAREFETTKPKIKARPKACAC
jgi:hypothetical protein